MRLIRQIKLYLKEGNSDKVYEVDLCEAGDGEFVVNFRYGRRGSTLREGTKTTFPVDEEEATRTYEKLVSSKTRKGYSTTVPEGAVEEASPETTSPGSPELTDDPRAQRVLQHLESAAEGRAAPSENWKLSRILWRAGEMGLREAAPHLVKIAGNGDAMHDISLAWALGRCGDERCVGALQDLLSTTQSAPARRFAEAGLLDLSEDTLRDELIRARAQAMPPSVAAVLKAEPAQLAAAVEEALQRTEGARDLLFDLYLIGPYVAGAREAVKDALRRIPLEHNSFKPVRHIYKLAEFRNDAEVFGWLSYRFEKTPETYSAPYGGIRHENKWQKVSDVMKRPDPGLAYSHNTRNHLRRRTLRILRRYGELDLDLYAEMAAGVLLAFDDSFDRKRPRKTTQWVRQDGGGYSAIESHYDVYDYPLINHVLYENSTRYQPKKGLDSWPCTGGYLPGQSAPGGREEAFPEIWDRNPDAVLRLLRGSACFAVHEFAVRVFRANPDFARKVDIPALIEVLGSPYEITAELAMDLAKDLYDPSNPNVELVAALATCPSGAARALALEWIRAQAPAFLGSPDFLLPVMCAPHHDVHEALRELIPAAGVSGETLRSVSSEILNRILAFDGRQELNEQVKVIGETLLAVAGEPLSRMDVAVILRLLDHPLDEVQALAGKLLVNHETPAAQLKDEVFEKLFHAESAAAREVGVELFGTLPDEVLLGKYAVLANFAMARQEELRRSVQPIIARLAAANADFARDMIAQCYPHLARKERYPGLHADLFQLLAGPLNDHLSAIPREHIDRLLDSRYESAQELGALVLDRYVDPADIPMRRLVKLGSHEMVAVRKLVRRAYESNVARMKQELEESVRLVDATWDDTRDFAFDYFRSRLEESDWKPDILVAIADSVNKPVQAFGRELITKYFDDRHGQTYLLKLSQHPSPDLQLFASNYLERYASDSPERIEALELFFVTVLCQVNRGRVAKDRVLAFLRSEALKGEETARLVVGMLNRQAATMAVGDKAACIETLRVIQTAHPNVEVPITVIEPPTLKVN